jgi:type II secretory pathway component GspD/PulD (secretin)
MQESIYSRNFAGNRLAVLTAKAVVPALSIALSLSAAGLLQAAPLLSTKPLMHSLRSVPQSSMYQAAAPSNISLDFVSADINDVLKALAVQSGANIVSSTDVKGDVTVSLNHVTLEQALDMVARLSGFQYAKANNAYVIGTPTSIASFSNASTDVSQVTEVIPLHYATVDDATGLIKQRYPTLQVSTGTQIAGNKVGATNAAVVLTGDEASVEAGKQLVDSLESNLSDRIAEQQTETYVPHFAALSDLITVLNTLVPSLLVIPGPGNGFSASAPSAGAAAASSSASAAGTTSTGSSSPSSGTSSGGGSTPGGGLTGPTMLLLTGSQTDIDHAKLILAKVDLKPAMILYEAKVTEINDQDQKNIGINWSFNTATTTIGEQGTVGDLGGVGTDSSSPVNLGRFTRTPISNLATATLDALFTNGDAKLLADPNIEAIDGFPANVFIGDTVNYVQSITTSTTGENVTTASVNVGVTLRVTGKVNPDGYVTLNIHPEVSTISSYLSTPGGGQLPNIATRFADTTVRVKDGETIAIGGLIQNNDIVNITKVPFFGDLPFVGQLFRDTQHGRNKTEVVFFLKTTIDKGA